MYHCFLLLFPVNLEGVSGAQLTGDQCYVVAQKNSSGTQGNTNTVL